MADSDYLLQLEDIKSKKFGEVVQLIKKMPGIQLASMTHADYLFYNGHPIFPGNGVYVFKIDNQVVYVGKTASRSFIERIPAHFDFRELAWMNSLLKNYCKQNDYTPNNDELIDAARHCLEHTSVIMINFNTPHLKEIKKKISVLENLLLRSDLQSWNKRKQNFLSNNEQTIAALLNF